MNTYIHFFHHILTNTFSKIIFAPFLISTPSWNLIKHMVICLMLPYIFVILCSFFLIFLFVCFKHEPIFRLSNSMFLTVKFNMNNFSEFSAPEFHWVSFYNFYPYFNMIYLVIHDSLFSFSTLSVVFFSSLTIFNIFSA